MFCSNLVLNNDDNLINIECKWMIQIQALIRVPFFDENDNDNAYVVSYSEKMRSYLLRKFSIHTGMTIWEISMVNGGYGTPVIWDELVLSLTSFNKVAAFDKNTGENKWEVLADGRIRTSLNVVNDYLYFAAGGTIYMVDNTGKIVNTIVIGGAFLYGIIDFADDKYISMGTIFDQETNSSRLCVWVHNLYNDLLFKVNIGDAHVMSSDTSGFWKSGDDIYVNCNTKVVKINLQLGKTVWETDVHTYCARSMAICEKENVYYTTIEGQFGCIDALSGDLIWEKSTHEKCIVSPPSICNGTLLILADCSLYLVDKITGLTYDKLTIGHSPYSACSIKGNYIFIGGGEPPINGLLICYKFTDSHDHLRNDVVSSSFYMFDAKKSNVMEIVVNTDGDYRRAELSSIDISNENTIEGVKVNRSFNFLVPIKENVVGGNYCLPIAFLGDESKKNRTILVNIDTKSMRPSKAIINEFYKEVKEISPYHSGAALSSMILKEYGKNVSQSEFRKMIDYSKEKSRWEDADFQTWRLILKRVLSNHATNVKEFIDHEEK